MGRRRINPVPQRINFATRAYSAMNESILTAINNGDLGVGDRLPSEADLRDQFSISVNSVRRGIDKLIEEGIVERRHGSGTFVRDLPPPQKPTQRDTIALLSDVCFRSYHPYYTELWAAVRTRLGRLGWKLWEVPLPETFYYEEDASYLPDIHAQLATAFREHPEFAGCVVTANLLDTVNACMDVNQQLPCIVPGLFKDQPSVGYNWHEEFSHVIKDIVDQGAKNILTVTNKNTKLDDIIKPYKKEGIKFNEVRVNSDIIFSHIVNDSRVATGEFLAKNKKIDGFFADSDFTAQGMFDAISETGYATKNKIHASALINKKSQIYTSIPFNAFYTDGSIVGDTLAELLNELITSPNTAPRSIQLRTSTSIRG